MSNTKMRRISSELDDYLRQMSRQLSVEAGRKVTYTDASRVLAMQRPNLMIMKKRGRELRIGGSLISL